MVHPLPTSVEIENILQDFLSEVATAHIAPEWVEQLRTLIANDQFGDTAAIEAMLAQLREEKRDG